MLIVGQENENPEDTHVHTIDMWFSAKRGGWVVERLDATGHLVGLAHFCACEHDARACLEDWLRAHAETHLVAPRELEAAHKVAAHRPRRRAA